MSLALGLIACSPEVTLFDAELVDGSFLVVARLEGGRLTGAASATFERGRAKVDTGGADELVVFAFAPGELLDEHGDPLVLPEARLAQEVDPCQRCPFFTDRLPALLHEGAACPIAREARVVGPERRDLDTLRRSIRVVRPGCPVPRPGLGRAPSLELEALPEYAFEVAARNAHGKDFIFSERFAAVVSGGVITHRTEDVPFLGPVLGVVGIEDGRIIVASLDLERVGATLWTAFDEDLHHVTLELAQGLASLPFRPRSLSAAEGTRFHGAGFRSLTLDHSSGALAATCVVDGARLDCAADLGDEGQQLVRDDFETSAYGPDGAIAAGTDSGELVIRTASGARLERMILDGDAADLGRGAPLFWIGGRLIVCGAQGQVGTVFAASASVAGSLALVGRFDNAVCAGWVSKVDGPRLVLTDGQVLAVEADGTLRAEGSLSSTAGAITPQKLFTAPRGAVLVLTSRRELYSGDALDPLTLSYQAPWDDAEGAAGIVDGDGGRAWVVHPTRVDELAFDEPRLTGTSWRLPLPEGDAVTAVERDPLGTAVYVAGVSRGDTFLRRIDLESGRVDDVPLPPSWPVIVDLARVTPRVLVAVGQSWSALRVENGASTPIELLWDDPGTAEVEARPTRGDEGCSVRRPLAGQDEALEAFQAVDAARGIAWASGCDAVVFRVSPFGPTPVGLRVALRSDLQIADDSLLSPRVVSLQAARALGPDWAVLAGPQHDDTVAYQAHVVEVAAGQLSDSGRSDGLLTQRYALATPPDSGRTPTTEDVLDLVGAWPDLVIVHSHYDGGLKVLRSSDRPIRSPLTATAAFLEDDHLAVAYTDGYLVAGRITRR
ncbi:MAG: hypothetical protein HYV07_34365 [Deltaproteobacteria bacterium]|nr:hypothetical protein [Deltaproteobacteria bacterium]